jgi:hypothetical protein
MGSLSYNNRSGAAGAERGDAIRAAIYMYISASSAAWPARTGPPASHKYSATAAGGGSAVPGGGGGASMETAVSSDATSSSAPGGGRPSGGGAGRRRRHLDDGQAVAALGGVPIARRRGGRAAAARDGRGRTAGGPRPGPRPAVPGRARRAAEGVGARSVRPRVSEGLDRKRRSFTRERRCAGLSHSWLPAKTFAPGAALRAGRAPKTPKRIVRAGWLIC